MVALGGGAISYERGTPVNRVQGRGVKFTVRDSARYSDVYSQTNGRIFTGKRTPTPAAGAGREVHGARFGAAFCPAADGLDECQPGNFRGQDP